MERPIGELHIPSGLLIAMSRASLLWWSGDRQPDDEGTDSRIAGPDAQELATLLGVREPHLYDLGDEALAQVRNEAAKAIADRGLRAHLMTLPRRVTHRRRVDLAVDAGGGAGVATFAGQRCGGVLGVPRRAGVPVTAHEGPSGAVHALVLGSDTDDWTPLLTLPGDAAIALMDADGAGLAGPSIEAHQLEPGRAEVVAVGPTRGALWAPPKGTEVVQVSYGEGGALMVRAGRA